MSISKLCKEYFHGFHDLSNWNSNSSKKNASAVFKVISYFFLFPPATVGLCLGLSLLYGRVTKGAPRGNQNITQQNYLDNAHRKIAPGPTSTPATHSSTRPMTSPVSAPHAAPVPAKKTSGPSHIQTKDSKKVRTYPGDLTPAEKSSLIHTSNENLESLVIESTERPQFKINIIWGNPLLCGADVLVNAADTALGGGAGVDAAIHFAADNRKAGDDYKKNKHTYYYEKSHCGIRSDYPHGYLEGHAAMITSNFLAKASTANPLIPDTFLPRPRITQPIENIIVVAGPDLRENTAVENKKVPTEAQKNALFSCYYNSLLLAHSQGKKSIAFPALSAGAFQYPKQQAAEVSMTALYHFMKNHPDSSLLNISIYFYSPTYATMDANLILEEGTDLEKCRYTNLRSKISELNQYMALTTASSAQIKLYPVLNAICNPPR